MSTRGFYDYPLGMYTVSNTHAQPIEFTIGVTVRCSVLPTEGLQQVAQGTRELAQQKDGKRL